MEQIGNARLRLGTFDCNLKGSAQHYTEVNFLPKLNDNILKGSGNMEQTQKC